MPYLGTHQIDDLLTFPANTHAADTGAATDADGSVSYRVFEDETATPILTGTMATLDASNTTGFYSEQITLSAANGFEVGKSYTIYIEAAVDSVTGTMSHTFQVEAAPATASALTTVDSVVDAILALLQTMQPIRSGTAQAGAAGSITLDASASATDDTYIGNWVYIRSGTGVGQSRFILDYVGSTKVASVAPNWVTTPSTDSVFSIMPASYVLGAISLSANAIGATTLQAGAITAIQSGLATATALQTVDDNVDTLVSSITTVGAVADAVWDEAISGHNTQGTFGESFNATVSGTAVTGTLSTTQMTTDLTEATDDHYLTRAIIWTTGALAGQGAEITAYNGTTKMLTYTTVTDAPSNGDRFKIY